MAALDGAASPIDGRKSLFYHCINWDVVMQANTNRSCLLTHFDGDWGSPSLPALNSLFVQSPTPSAQSAKNLPR